MRPENLQIEGPIKLPLLLVSGKVEEFEIYHFKSPQGKYQILVKGDVRGKGALTRIESACTYAHLYGSQLCDCQWQLRESLKRIAENGRGILIYAMDQHCMGVGFDNHIRVCMEEQGKDLDTIEAHKSLGLEVDARDYSDIADILRHFGISDVELLTNNPRRIRFLESEGFGVKRIPLEVEVNRFNEGDLSAKKKKLGHLLSKIE